MMFDLYYSFRFARARGARGQWVPVRLEVISSFQEWEKWNGDIFSREINVAFCTRCITRDSKLGEMGRSYFYEKNT